MDKGLRRPVRLLSQEEYDEIIALGEAAEALQRYVRRRPGKPPSPGYVSRAAYMRSYRERMKKERDERTNNDAQQGTTK